MSTTYNHIRMSTIDSSNNIAILYPESTSSDNEDSIIDYTSGSGTATSDKVLQGYTFSNSNGVNIPGTMLNQGTKTYTIDPGDTQVIPEGYHNGLGSVTASGGKDSTYTMTDSQISGDVDLGVNNTYRYINATNVYNKGVSDGAVPHTGTYTLNDVGTIDMGEHHTYRYVNSSYLALEPETLLVTYGDIVRGTVVGRSGYNIPEYTNPYSFRVVRFKGNRIYLLGQVSLGKYTYNSCKSWRWNVSFDANTLTNKPKQITDYSARLPSYDALNSNAIPYAYRLPSSISYWTDTTTTDSYGQTVAYFVSATGDIYTSMTSSTNDVLIYVTVTWAM